MVPLLGNNAAKARGLRDAALHDALESATAAAEKKTAAEVVVVICSASGSYRDTDLLAGGLAAMAALTVILFAPVTVNPLLVLPYVLAAAVLGAVVCGRSHRLRRLFTRQTRRRKQVASGARLALVEEGVTATRERNGVLIYVSELERAVEILGDLGVEGRIAQGELNRIAHGLQGVPPDQLGARLVAAVEQLGELLAPAFPATDDNPNEIPDRPRLRA